MWKSDYLLPRPYETDVLSQDFLARDVVLVYRFVLCTDLPWPFHSDVHKALVAAILKHVELAQVDAAILHVVGSVSCRFSALATF